MSNCEATLFHAHPNERFFVCFVCIGSVLSTRFFFVLIHTIAIIVWLCAMIRCQRLCTEEKTLGLSQDDIEMEFQMNLCYRLIAEQKTIYCIEKSEKWRNRIEKLPNIGNLIWLEKIKLKKWVITQIIPLSLLLYYIGSLLFTLKAKKLRFQFVWLCLRFGTPSTFKNSKPHFSFSNTMQQISF